MTDPTQLSPAAQAVWDAAWQLSPVNCGSHEDRRRQQIAAALRAAADQCKIEWDYHPDYPETLSVVIASDLLAIATELENAQ